MADSSFEHVTTVRYEDKELHILGTAHVSKRSADDARAVIASLKPNSVCVELDPLRHEALVDESRWKKLDVFQVIRERKVLYLLASLVLSAYQRRIGEKLGVKPGAEMLAAIEAAGEEASQLVLADRNIQATLKRTWANLSWWNKGRVVASMVGSYFAAGAISEDQIEALKDRDAVSEMLEEFARAFPQVKQPLIDERDAYLISAVREAPGPVVVAVVGAGHVNGMVERLHDEVNRERLSEIPPPSATGKVLKWAIPALVLAVFARGILGREPQELSDMLMAWVLPNALFAGLGGILSGARFLTTLVAIVGSPITSLNPALPLGVLTGTAEAWARRPTVEDCEGIHDASKSLRGIYRNRFTRVLWVTFLTTMGSAIGGYVGAAQLLAYLDLRTVLGALIALLLVAVLTGVFGRKGSGTNKKNSES